MRCDRACVSVKGILFDPVFSLWARSPSRPSRPLPILLGLVCCLCLDTQNVLILIRNTNKPFWLFSAVVVVARFSSSLCTTFSPPTSLLRPSPFATMPRLIWRREYKKTPLTKSSYWRKSVTMKDLDLISLRNRMKILWPLMDRCPSGSLLWSAWVITLFTENMLRAEEKETFSTKLCFPPRRRRPCVCVCVRKISWSNKR